MYASCLALLRGFFCLFFFRNHERMSHTKGYFIFYIAKTGLYVPPHAKKPECSQDLCWPWNNVSGPEYIESISGATVLARAKNGGMFALLLCPKKVRRVWRLRVSEHVLHLQLNAPQPAVQGRGAKASCSVHRSALPSTKRTSCARDSMI